MSELSTEDSKKQESVIEQNDSDTYAQELTDSVISGDFAPISTLLSRG